jgi:biopolymer transport protein ExbD
MIDVLLVLLIIFMVIIPMGRKAFDVQLPDPTAPPPPKNQKTDQIVLEVNPGEQFLINKAPVSKSELYQKLKDIYDPRPTKVLFIKGDPEVVYQDVIFAMDQARGAGVKVIGATPPPATGGK